MKRNGREIYIKRKAHNSFVDSLCPLNGNRLLSCGGDHSIKVWSLSDVELILIKGIKANTLMVYKFIPSF